MKELDRILDYLAEHAHTIISDETGETAEVLIGGLLRSLDDAWRGWLFAEWEVVLEFCNACADGSLEEAEDISEKLKISATFAIKGLPDIFGHNPLQLLAEEASPKLIHDWIDSLYEGDFNPNDRNFLMKVYTVAAISEHINTYPLNREYQEKFDMIAECVVGIGTVALEEMQAAP